MLSSLKWPHTSLCSLGQTYSLGFVLAVLHFFLGGGWFFLWLLLAHNAVKTVSGTQWPAEGKKHRAESSKKRVPFVQRE